MPPITRHRFLRYLLLPAICCMALLVACLPAGYKDSKPGALMDKISGEPVIPRSANRIVIPYFKNMTTQPSVAELATLRTRELISQDGRLSVVARSEDADLRLTGIVVQYQVQPVHFNPSGEVVRKRLRVVIAVRLTDLKRDRDIFRDEQVQAFEVYSEVLPPIVPENQAVIMLIEGLARRIAVKTVTGWYTSLMTSEEKGKR